MPIVPIYRRQEKYQLPSVQTSSSGVQRLKASYENTLQQVAPFAQNFLDHMKPSIPGFEEDPEESQWTQRARKAFSNPEKTKTARQSAGWQESAAVPDEDLQIRSELAQTVRQHISEGNPVQTEVLDRFAASRLDAAQPDTPASRDYLMLRAAARQEEGALQRQSRQTMARQESALIRSVGATAGSAQTLEHYLQGQLPALQKRLQENGATPAAAQKQARAITSQTAAECVRRGVASGNLAAAAGVFQKYESQMAPCLREDCLQKLQLGAADFHSRLLWQQAELETDGSPQAREKWAAGQLEEEKNESFKKQVRENLAELSAAALQQQHRQQADLYRQLAELPSGQACGLLDSQQALDPSEIALARRAAQRADWGRDIPSQPELFNRLYFSGTEKEIARSYEKNQLSARDYWRLQAARHDRAAGKDDAPARLLAKAVELWSGKKGLSEQEGQTVKYAVLASSGDMQNQLDAWRRVKSLLDN